MRRVTRQEGESWRALAQRHGFGSAEGRFVLGRFIVEDRDENDLVLCVVTPIPAGLDAETPQLKALPVMFDRTPADEIVVPGRRERGRCGAGRDAADGRHDSRHHLRQRCLASPGQRYRRDWCRGFSGQYDEVRSAAAGDSYASEA
jgi:hypothetical protein